MTSPQVTPIAGLDAGISMSQGIVRERRRMEETRGKVAGSWRPADHERSMGSVERRQSAVEKSIFQMSRGSGGSSIGRGWRSGLIARSARTILKSIGFRTGPSEFG